MITVSLCTLLHKYYCYHQPDLLWNENICFIWVKKKLYYDFTQYNFLSNMKLDIHLKCMYFDKHHLWMGSTMHCDSKMKKIVKPRCTLRGRVRLHRQASLCTSSTLQGTYWCVQQHIEHPGQAFWVGCSVLPCAIEIPNWQSVTGKISWDKFYYLSTRQRHSLASL